MKLNKRSVRKTRVSKKAVVKKLDPHHCRCFSIPKIHFHEFESRLLRFGYSEPLLEEDHGQILGFTKRLNESYQIHVKLMKTGRIEGEIEYPPDYPMAHLNSTHSFSAHAELNLLFSALQISHKCKHNPPITCIRRQIIPAQQPTHLGTFLAAGGVSALADIIFNDGKITEAVLRIAANEFKKQQRRRSRRRKFLN